MLLKERKWENSVKKSSENGGREENYDRKLGRECWKVENHWFRLLN